MLELPFGMIWPGSAKAAVLLAAWTFQHAVVPVAGRDLLDILLSGAGRGLVIIAGSETGLIPDAVGDLKVGLESEKTCGLTIASSAADFA